jgi:hypothetical protein
MMLHANSQSYGAVGAYQNLHSLKRLSCSTGKEIYARVEELLMLLRRKGFTVSEPGQESPSQLAGSLWPMPTRRSLTQP